MRPVICVVLAAYCFWPGGTATGAEEPPLKERFTKEAAKRWGEYMEGAKRLQGTWASTTSDGAGKALAGSRLEFRQNKNCAMVLVEKPFSKGVPATVDVLNAGYAFALRRSAPDKPWAITGQQLDLKGGYTLTRTPPPEGVANWVGAPFNLDGTAFTRLREVVKDGNFKVTSALPVIRAGKTLVEVTFSARPQPWPPGDKFGWMPLSGGKIVFDPDHFWVVRECHVKVARPAVQDGAAETLDAEFTYKEGKKGFPIPTKIVRKWGAGIKNVQTFDLKEQDDVPDSAFTLSALGLPEPAELKPVRPQAWYIWAGVAGGVCLALGGCLRWLAKRRAA